MTFSLAPPISTSESQAEPFLVLDHIFLSVSFLVFMLVVFLAILHSPHFNLPHFPVRKTTNSVFLFVCFIFYIFNAALALPSNESL